MFVSSRPSYGKREEELGEWQLFKRNQTEGLTEIHSETKERVFDQLKVGQLLLIHTGLFKLSGTDFPDGVEVAAGFLRFAWSSCKTEASLRLASWELALVGTSASPVRSSVEKLRPPSLARECECLSGDRMVRPTSQS